MTKIKAPSDPDGLREVLTDHGRLKEYFSPEAVADGTTREFLDAYAQVWAKQHPDAVGDVRDQVQSVLFDMIRDNGGGRKPHGIDLANAVQFDGHRPRLALSGDGTGAVSRGRGAVYNKFSLRARSSRTPTATRPTASSPSASTARRSARKPGRPRTKNRKELLQKLENVRSFQNSFGSEDPGAGGFLIPEIMRSELLQLALEDIHRPQPGDRHPDVHAAGSDPDRGRHVATCPALFGGVQFYWAEESASLTESQATFGKVVLDAKKLTGFFKVPNELLADAPAFSRLVRHPDPGRPGVGRRRRVHDRNRRGHPAGVHQLPGIGAGHQGSPGQAASTIVWENILNMYVRMLPTSLKNAVWIASIDTFPEIWPRWRCPWARAARRRGRQLPRPGRVGRPARQHPRPSRDLHGEGPALGTTGDINFVDLSYYLIGDRQAVEVAASDQAFFQNDQTAYRIIERVDGRPWLQTALTPHNGSSNTLSAFVQLATRS